MATSVSVPLAPPQSLQRGRELNPGLLPASVSEINGAKRWVRLGPFSIQPGELAKLLIIVFAAAFLVAKRDLFRSAGRRFLGTDLPRLRDLAPLIVGWLASLGVLTLERELGASLLVFGVVLALVYTATSRVSWVIVGLLFFTVGVFVAYTMFAHVQTRVMVWLDPVATTSAAAIRCHSRCSGWAPADWSEPVWERGARTWFRWPTPTSSPQASGKSSV